jgi:hypothetical protein
MSKRAPPNKTGVNSCAREEGYLKRTTFGNWLSSQRLVVICVISCDDRSLTLWLGYHCLLQVPDFAETLKHRYAL